MDDAQATAMLLTVLTTASSILGGEQAVLFVNFMSKIEQVDSPGLRKLSVGLTMTCSGERLRPILNELDVQVKKVFLQNADSISDITDDRRLLRLAHYQGRTQLVAHKNIASFSTDYPTDPLAGGYTRVTNVENNPDVKILRVVCQN